MESDTIQAIEEPKIENRKDLHEFLEVAIAKTYELEKKYQRLKEDINMVKSYIVESHKPVTSLSLENYTIKISKTEDSTLHVVKFKKNNKNKKDKKFSTLYVDTYNPRFWTIHTVEKSEVIDPFIDKIARHKINKDYVWFPSQYMERFAEMGSPRSISIQFSELITKEEEQIGDLSMKLWGSASSGVFKLFRNLSKIRSIITQKELAHILEECEGLSYSSPLSGIGIKCTANGSSGSEQFILDDIGHKGKFTARGGNSIEGHLFLLRHTKNEYADTIKYIEEEIAIAPAKTRPLTLSGHPVTIFLTRSIDDIHSISQEVISCRYPFRFLGFPRYEFEDMVAITGVDLHTGGKLNIEITPDWIRLYLSKGACGNTVIRFYSLIQHNFDSNAQLEGIEYGRLF